MNTRISKKRIGKSKSWTKHLQKGVGSSRKRNMKRTNNKIQRQKGKKSVKDI